MFQLNTIIKEKKLNLKLQLFEKNLQLIGFEENYNVYGRK